MRSSFPKFRQTTSVRRRSTVCAHGAADLFGVRIPAGEVSGDDVTERGYLALADGMKALYPHLRYVALTERRTFSAEVNSFCAKLYDGENGTASRAGSTGDSGRRNRFPTRIHTKKGRSALILRTFCPEKRKRTF